MYAYTSLLIIIHLSVHRRSSSQNQVSSPFSSFPGLFFEQDTHVSSDPASRHLRHRVDAEPGSAEAAGGDPARTSRKLHVYPAWPQRLWPISDMWFCQHGWNGLRKYRRLITGWWFGTCFYFPIDWGYCNHANWLIFFGGNQIMILPNCLREMGHGGSHMCCQGCWFTSMWDFQSSE